MKPPTKFEVTQMLQRLNRMDPTKVTFEAIKTTYSRAMAGLGIIINKTSGAELFFRARVNNGWKLTKTDELHAPPPERVHGFQRCNRPGHPMFYSSSRRASALSECRAQVGDVVYLSQWIGHGKIPFNRLLEDHGDQQFIDQLRPVDHLLLSHFDTLFTRRIHETFSDDYKFTAAITELLTNRFQAWDKYNVGADGYVALRYPSVRQFDGAYNTAMNPDFARERLRLVHVMELTVTHLEPEIRIAVTDNAFDFPDGLIKWTGDVKKVPALRPPERHVGFISIGQRCLIQTLDKEPTAEYLAAMMLE